MTDNPSPVPPFRRNDAQVIRAGYAIAAVALALAAVGFLVGFLA